MKKQEFVKSNTVPIDRNIQAIWNFILATGTLPIPPDSERGKAYTTATLGNLGEQYVECIFKFSGITRLSLRKKKPSPDFKVSLLGKDFLLEAKIVRSLYKGIYQLLYEIGRREHRYALYRKLERLIRNYKISISPKEVSIQDEKKFKNKLRKLIPKIRLPLNQKMVFSLKSNTKDYNFSLEPLKTRKNLMSWPPRETAGLESIIYRKKRQIGSSDILVVILLNNEVQKKELLDFFSKALKQSIWDLRFRNEDGNFSTIGEKLKSVIVIYPIYQTAFLFFSPKNIGDFNSRYRSYLKRYLKSRGFRTIEVLENKLTPDLKASSSL